MKSAVHQYEDKLLEFAYGELARQEADAVEAHVRGCARCSQALDEIGGVRATMSQLPMVPAPDAGLDSLLAYAEQAAKRNAEGTARPVASIWKRFLAPLVTVMALLTVGVVGFRAKEEFDTSPASAAADTKVAEMEAKKDAPPPPAVAQAEQPPPVAAAPQPQPHPAPAVDELAANKDPNVIDAPVMKAALGAPKEEAEKPVEISEVANNKKGGKALEAGITPQSVTRRASPKTDNTESDSAFGDMNDTLADGKKAPPPPPPPANTGKTGSDQQQKNEAAGGKEGAVAAKPQDWSNAAQRGGKDNYYVDDLTKSADKAPTKAPTRPQMAPKQPEEPTDGWSDKTARQKADVKEAKQAPKESPRPEAKPDVVAKAPAPSAPNAPPPSSQGTLFGLNNGSTGSSSGVGGLGTSSNSPNANAGPARAELAAKAKEEEKLEKAKLAAEQSRRDEELRRSAAEKSPQAGEAEAQYRPSPAPTTVAPPAPSSPMMNRPEPKKKSKDSMSLTPYGMSSSSPGSGGRAQQQTASLDEDGAAVTASERERNETDDSRKMVQQGREMAVDLIEQARVASSRGDRSSEIQLASRAIQLGATGLTKVEALKRLCDAYDALGESERADAYCTQLLKEFPSSAAAQVVAQKRNAQRVSPAKAKKSAPAPVDRKAYDFEEAKEPKPADAAPALQSY